MGGKALGKDLPIEKANDIVHGVWANSHIRSPKQYLALPITSLGNTVGSNRRRRCQQKEKAGQQDKARSLVSVKLLDTIDEPRKLHHLTRQQLIQLKVGELSEQIIETG